jgi:hypothetical protein
VKGTRDGASERESQVEMDSERKVSRGGGAKSLFLNFFKVACA